MRSMSLQTIDLDDTGESDKLYTDMADTMAEKAAAAKSINQLVLQVTASHYTEEGVVP